MHHLIGTIPRTTVKDQNLNPFLYVTNISFNSRRCRKIDSPEAPAGRVRSSLRVLRVAHHEVSAARRGARQTLLLRFPRGDGEGHRRRGVH